MGRLPDDAFAQYMTMGPERSYESLAGRLKVDKRTITRLAAKEHWQERLAKIEAEARSRLDDKLAEGIEAVNARHIKTLRVIQAKALQTLQSYPLDSAMDAVRALDIAIKHERVILGEPSERTAVSVEEVIKREYQRWMGPSDDESDGWGAPPESPAPPASSSDGLDEEADDEDGAVAP